MQSPNIFKKRKKKKKKNPCKIGPPLVLLINIKYCTEVRMRRKQNMMYLFNIYNAFNLCGNFMYTDIKEILQIL